MHSIRSIIFSSLALVVSVFFLLAGGAVYLLTERVINQFFIEDNSSSIEFVVQNVRSNYQANLYALHHLSVQQGFLSFDQKKADELVRQFLKFDHIFGSVHVYRADGALLISHSRPMKPAYEPEQNFFQKWDKHYIQTAKEVIATGKPQATETFQRVKSGLYQAYLVPIFYSKSTRVFGFISGAIFYQQQDLNYLLEGLKLGERNFIVLTDRLGNVLVQNGITQPLTLPLIAPVIQQATDSFFDHAEIQTPVKISQAQIGRNLPYYVFSGPIKELNLLLTVGASDHMIKSKMSTLIEKLTIALLFGLLLSFVISIFVSNRLAQPFHLLNDAVTRVNSGDFSAEINYRKNDEIAELCESFNQISRKISKGRLLGNLWGSDEP